MNNFLSHVNDFLYSYILIFLLVGAGIYFSIRTRFVQLTLLKDAFLALKEKSSDGENASEKPVSSFQALMISTASRVGTGNIAGIATALAAGGPGAIFWMWIMAVIGGASAFVESTLAQVYKVKDGDSFRGGPSYYIERALKKRWLGVLFSVLLICCFASRLIIFLPPSNTMSKTIPTQCFRQLSEQFLPCLRQLSFSVEFTGSVSLLLCLFRSWREFIFL